jgi:phage-related protein
MACRYAACAQFEGGTLGGAVLVAKPEIARLVLCFHDETLIVLHGFIKKTQKTPADDLALSKRRMAEVTQ